MPTQKTSAKKAPKTKPIKTITNLKRCLSAKRGGSSTAFPRGFELVIDAKAGKVTGKAGTSRSAPKDTVYEAPVADALMAFAEVAGIKVSIVNA